MSDDKLRDGGILTALAIGCWCSFFGFATAVSAYGLFEAHTRPDPRLTPLHSLEPVADVRTLVMCGYCVFTSLILLFTGLVAAGRFVLGRK